MAETKKAGTPRAKKQASAPKKAPETVKKTMEAVTTSELALVPPQVEAVETALQAVQSSPALAEPLQIADLPKRGEALQHAVSEAVVASAHGVLEVNDKIIDALQTQSTAALDLWRSAISAPHLTEAFRLQTNGTRHAYETASAQWRDIAETTARWLTRSVAPFQAVLTDRVR